MRVEWRNEDDVSSPPDRITPTAVANLPCHGAASSTGRPWFDGVLFLVVGPSGVGKDTVIDGAKARLEAEPEFVFARRVVTRPSGSSGEDHEPMTEAEFAAAEAAGAFVMTWRAHGLGYGVRSAVLDHLSNGRNVVVNASRTVVADFTRKVRQVAVLSITASPEAVRSRLAARGREDAADVAARLSRRVPLQNADLVIEISNDGAPEEAIDRMVAALLGAATLPLTLLRAPFEMPGEPVCIVHEDALVVRGKQLAGEWLVEVGSDRGTTRARLAMTRNAGIIGPREVALSGTPVDRFAAAEGARVLVRRAPRPPSRDLVRRKVAGDELDAREIGMIVDDIVDGRYTPPEIAGFLVAAANGLTVAEVAALTAARAECAGRLAWDGPLVANKHSLGGVPGGRVTMIAVPIAVAHGLLVPKTSSRAITSAAGTADVMECAARVDLSVSEFRSTVETAGGALAWTGHISHSPLDDVMNAITRPLGIRSASLDVASILSKTLTVGSTHVVIDVPFGPGTKSPKHADAEGLARLFETVGRAVSLSIDAMVTEGAQPTGRGIGPAIELAEVRGVLSGEPGAPAAFAAKAIAVAGRMIEWDPSVPPGDGSQLARELLLSGAALEAFERMIEAQGRRTPVQPGQFVHTLTAPSGGVLERIDGQTLSGLARAAGAPADKGAGVRIRVPVGAGVREGEPLIDIVSGSVAGLERAQRFRATGTLFTIR